ncbi:hypothetical protein QWZ10_03830 [Paracoccus cavernae]|uniref:Peptidase M48 domain-containing protein n=1 Tax=Paracoccus cavernae TaxID=1571207 RepID=A0ABT8D5K0_9RHOB|nr:hypothetical protein [Paracoccus cavernae]
MPVKSTEARLRKTVAVMALSLGLAAQGGWIQPAFAQGAPDADAAVQFRGLPDAEPAAAALGVADMAGLLAKSTASAAEIKDAQTALDGVMTLTGLPQNFTLVLADVPRISAVILPDDNGIPRRVLVVPQERTGNLAQARAAQDWPLLAALAHEVSHHLMGHSLLAGASMPVEEREADRNAGFLLERMGADLPAALAAIDAANAGDPAKRLAALPQLEELAAGWIQACGEDGAASSPCLSRWSRAPSRPARNRAPTAARAQAPISRAMPPRRPMLLWRCCAKSFRPSSSLRMRGRRLLPWLLMALRNRQAPSIRSPQTAATGAAATGCPCPIPMRFR